jgi:hypothetical protein
MTASFTSRDGSSPRHPQKREAGGEKFYIATDAELANPEWVSKFTLNNPGVKLVSNKPVTMGKPNV